MNTGRRRRFAHALLLVQVLMSMSLALFYVASRVFDMTGYFDPFAIFFAVIMAIYGVVGYLVVMRQPHNPIGPMLCGVGPVWLISEVGDTYAQLRADGRPLPGAEWAAWAGEWAWVPALSLIGIFLLILFPDGRPPSPRWRPVVWAGLAGTSLATASSAIDSSRLEGGFANPLGVEGWIADFLSTGGLAIFLASFLAAAASLIVRMKSASGERRQQVKWLLYPAAMVGPLLILAWLSEVFGSACPGGCASWKVIGAVGWLGMLAMVLLGFPIAMGIAILKHRLYDIDVVINKTLVYGALAAFITAVYVAVVVGVGTLLGSGGRPNLALSIGATAIVALLFQSVRGRVERVANRLVFGARATPYEVMSAFGHDMSQVLAVEDVLPRLAEIAAAGVGATRAKATLVLPTGATHSVAWPQDVTEERYDAHFTVADETSTIGEVAIAKAPGDAVTPADQKLLSDLASEAAVALKNARLTAELQARLDDIAAQARELEASRERIVTAADLGRKRLERDLASGPEKKLRGLIDELARVHVSLGDGVVDAASRLDRIATETAQTLDELRGLARGIFPPLLGDKGLVAALDAYVTKLDSLVSLEVDDALEEARFQRAIESALYFYVVEAVTQLTGNGKSPVSLRVGMNGDEISVEVATRSSKAGDLDLLPLRDRIEAIAGSVRVARANGSLVLAARVPVQAALEPVP